MARDHYPDFRDQFLADGIHNPGELIQSHFALFSLGERAMTNRSFADMSIQQRHERIAAVLALGLSHILDPKSKISANSLAPTLELLSGLRLSVPQPEIGDPEDADDD